MAVWRTFAVILTVVLLASVVSAEIHRAKTRPKPAIHRHSQLTEPVKPGHSRETWILSMISALLVGLSGIFPLLVIPLEAGKALRKGEMAHRLKILLSFAVGALLGDVFLHLLPEAWKHIAPDDHRGHAQIGLWIIGGILTFMLVEKIFPGDEEDEEETGEEEKQESSTTDTSKQILNGTTKNGIHPELKHRQNGKVLNGTVTNGKVHGDEIMNGKIQNGKVRNGKIQNGKIQNGVQNGKVQNGKIQNGKVQNGKINGLVNGTVANGSTKVNTKHDDDETSSHIKTSGWLNLTANIIDNFTHGLAVAGSYCISTKSGILTTIIILLHEIPHEVGDFAILLRSGFNRWHAAQAQLLTASGGLIGALTALSAESAESAGNSTAWILPFTSGGFIYVALVTVVPDLLKEKDPWESIKQLVTIISGIGIMATVGLWFDEHDLPSMTWLTDLIPA